MSTYKITVINRTGKQVWTWRWAAGNPPVTCRGPGLPAGVAPFRGKIRRDDPT